MAKFEIGEKVIVNASDNNYLKVLTVLDRDFQCYLLTDSSGHHWTYHESLLRPATPSNKPPVKGDWVYGWSDGDNDIKVGKLSCDYMMSNHHPYELDFDPKFRFQNIRPATEEEILEEKKRRGETEVEKPSNYYYSGDEGFLEYIGKSDSIFKHGDIANIERREDFNDGSRTYHLTCGRMMTTDQKGNNSDFYYHKDKPTPSFESIWDKRPEISFPTGEDIHPGTVVSRGLWNWDKISKSVGYNTEPWDTEDLYAMLGLVSKGSIFRSTPRTEVLTKTKTKKKLNLKFRTK